MAFNWVTGKESTKVTIAQLTNLRTNIDNIDTSGYCASHDRPYYTYDSYDSDYRNDSDYRDCSSDYSDNGNCPGEDSDEVFTADADFSDD